MHQNRSTFLYQADRPLIARCLLALTAALLLSACATPLQWKAYPDADSELSASDWAVDIEYLARELPTRNPHFADDPVMAAAFAAKASAMISSLGSAEPGQLGAETGAMLADRTIAGLAELLALVGEGHTALNAYPTGYFQCYLRWFASGPGYEARLLALDPGTASVEPVSGTPPATPTDALGASLLGVVAPAGGRLAPEGTLIPDGGGAGPGSAALSLERAVDAAVSKEANIPEDARAIAYRNSRGIRLNDPRLMAGLGLAGLDEAGRRSIRYRMRLDSGAVFDLIVRESEGSSSVASARGEAKPVTASGSGPWWSVRTGLDGSVLAGGPVLLMNYSSCDADAYPFLRAVIAELESGSVERLVIDLRANGGGNSMPGTWFASRLARIARFKEPGRVHVLTGPGTFSSAMWLSVDLMHKTPARFAGLPIAESPDSYGEVGRMALPASGLVIGYSTKLHRYSAGKDLRLRDGVIAPDEGLFMEPSYPEWLEGRDRLFELVLADAP